MGCCGMMTSQAEAITISSYQYDTHEPTGNAVAGTYLFLFHSRCPWKVFKQWSEQAQKIHAPLIIRGLLNDSFADTQKAVKQMTVNSHGGVVIDPRLFQTYHITQVPAVVVRQSVVTTTCLPNQSCWQPEEDEVVMGDIGLESALKTIAQEDNRVADIAQQKLAQWRAS